MGDRYVHFYPFTGRWDHRQDNLITLGRYLVVNSGSIGAEGGLAFGYDEMTGFSPLPDEIAMVSQVPLPPLAHGPRAGLRAEPGDDWPAYVQRVFGVHNHRPFMAGLQAAMWGKTEPSPVGAALRIAYSLEYGVPHDYVEIAMGQAYTDYASNGFLWEKLGTLPPDDEQGDARPRRKWPAWIGAVELERRRLAVWAWTAPMSARSNWASAIQLSLPYGRWQSHFRSSFPTWLTRRRKHGALRTGGERPS